LMAAVAVAKDTTGDGKRTFFEICAENGFKTETATVVTEDGYILTVWRIPGLINEEQSSEKKPPVFFQHGILDAGTSWVAHWPDVAPAFVAARAGYDVWIGNSRGNTYSRTHISLDPDSNKHHSAKKYWDFDWQEMGMYDLPAVFDHITEVSGHEKVAYIGHSQGTTQMYYALAMNQEYMASKVSVSIMFGPVTKISHNTSDIFHFAGMFYDELDDAVSLFGVYELLGQNWFTSTAVKLFCNHIPHFCTLLEKFTVSSDPKTDDLERFQVLMDHEPNGAPTKSVLHYA